jgi:hypothetical protein
VEIAVPRAAEVFGGWYLVEANDLDGALEVAGRIPGLAAGV